MQPEGLKFGIETRRHDQGVTLSFPELTVDSLEVVDAATKRELLFRWTPSAASVELTDLPRDVTIITDGELHYPVTGTITVGPSGEFRVKEKFQPRYDPNYDPMDV